MQNDDDYMCSLPITKGAFEELAHDGISIKTFYRLKQWCRKNTEYHMKAKNGLSSEYNIGKAHAYSIVADMIELIETEQIEKSAPCFTAEEVQDILVEYGQSSDIFKLGAIIRFTPSDVAKILNLKYRSNIGE